MDLGLKAITLFEVCVCGAARTHAQPVSTDKLTGVWKSEWRNYTPNVRLLQLNHLVGMQVHMD